MALTTVTPTMDRSVTSSADRIATWIRGHFSILGISTLKLEKLLPSSSFTTLHGCS
jgi:hypothetical protein